MKPKKLSSLRHRIDNLDSKIIKLVNERGKISCEIGEIKKRRKQPLYSPDRESQVYKKILEENSGPLSEVSMKAIYREVMSACLSLEQPLTIAYLGPELTFTHQASMKRFGGSVDYLSCDSISEVFHAVEKDLADYGVVPIENSTEGAVNHTLDMFVDSPLIICSEIYCKIQENLLSKGKSLRGIKKIYSYPNVFGQCRKWIEKNLPSASLHDTASTSKAAEIAAKQKSAACIASEIAAKKYKLNVLAKSIEDSATNITRFLVIGKTMSKISGNDKTSIVFSVKDRPGILHDMLDAFKKNSINLTKIESRPSKKKLWKYYFFIDMEGHAETPKIKKTLSGLKNKCYFLKTLGSYPKGE